MNEISETAANSSAISLGKPLLRFAELDSTNNYARLLAQQGATEGTAVLARQQSAGRGRQGRAWVSPPDAGLYLSLILRPQVTLARAAFLPLAAAIAVAETLRFDYHTAADIKYPNDVLVGGRKICGILVESASDGEQVSYAVLGIGVNLAQRQFPEALRDIATSLFLEAALDITPEQFLEPLLRRLGDWYPRATEQPQQVIERWESLSSYARDCAVRVFSAASRANAPADIILDGVTRGLAPTGALRIETADGDIHEVVSGEITLRKSGV